MDLSVITCAFPEPGWLPAEHIRPACRLANKLVKKTVEKYPGRFAGLAFLPWQYPKAAVAEVEWAADNGFIGVMLFTRSGDICPDDPTLACIYEACARLSMPVVLHPNMPFRYDDLEPYGLVAPIGFVMETSLALLKMIASGLFDRHENLKVLMPHAGGVLPFLDGRLNKNRSRLPAGASLDSQGAIVDCLKSGNIWYDLANASPQVLKFAFDYFPEDKLVFASDYPFIDPGLMRDMIEASGASELEKAQIYWKNAKTLFDFAGI